MNKHWSMLQQYQRLAIRVDSIALRERMLLLIALITVIYFLWSILLMSPARQAIDLAKIEEAALVKQVTASQQKIAAVERNVTTLLTNTQPLSTAPGSVQFTEATVIPMFKSLLTKQEGIVLKGLYNFPDQPLNLSTNNAALKLPLPLYEQGTELVFDGNYLSTHEYLRSLENLEWMIFWDKLQYVVTTYPNAEVRLIMHTIGPDKKN